MQAALLIGLLPGSVLPFLGGHPLLRKWRRQVGREALRRVRPAAALGAKGSKGETLHSRQSAQQAVSLE